MTLPWLGSDINHTELLTPWVSWTTPWRHSTLKICTWSIFYIFTRLLLQTLNMLKSWKIQPWLPFGKNGAKETNDMDGTGLQSIVQRLNCPSTILTWLCHWNACLSGDHSSSKQFAIQQFRWNFFSFQLSHQGLPLHIHTVCHGWLWNYWKNVKLLF